MWSCAPDRPGTRPHSSGARRSLPPLDTLGDFHGKYWEYRKRAGSVSVGEGNSPEASAVVTGHGRLFLREAQQLLPDGLDQGGRRVSRRRGLEGRRRGQVAQAQGVHVHEGSRRLLDNTSGGLEDRGVRVVRRIQELKAGGREESRKRRGVKD